MDAQTAIVLRWQLRRQVDAVMVDDWRGAMRVAQDASRNTLLHVAGGRQLIDVDQAMRRLSAWADISARNAHGYTCFHVAARAANAVSLRALLALLVAHPTFGRDAAARQRLLDAREWNGRMYTALHLAVLAGSRPCVEALLAAGADATLLDSGGASAAVMAANKQRHLLHLLSSEWYSREWSPALHARWPVSFQRDARCLLLLLHRLGARLWQRDVRLLLVRALGERYRVQRLRNKRK